MNKDYRFYTLKYIHLIDVNKIVNEYLETENKELKKRSFEELRKFYRYKAKTEKLWGTIRQWTAERIAFGYVWNAVINNNDTYDLEWLKKKWIEVVGGDDVYKGKEYPKRKNT